jgi:S-adenosylmethionine synthetase
VKVDAKEQGAGDQGMMFGYATNETENYMPVAIDIANRLIWELTAVRKAGVKMKYLRPDAKVQVTMEYTPKGKPIGVHTLVVSTQHDEFRDSEYQMISKIRADVKKVIIPSVRKKMPAMMKRYLKKEVHLLVNPTGKFVIGGPHGDTGLTGRKIIVDTYGGKCPHGGGAFSGKDPSKVDRSAAYAARHIAKNLVAAGVAKEITVQVAYAIGIAEPVSLRIETNDTTKVKDAKGKPISNDAIVKVVKKLFDMTPHGIIERFGLKNPIYLPTAAGGHFGREPYSKDVEVFYKDKRVRSVKKSKGERLFKTVDFFPWEKLDHVDAIKKEFSIA